MNYLPFFKKFTSNKKIIYLTVNKIDIKVKEKLDTALKNLTTSNTAGILLGINTNLPNAKQQLVYADQIGEALQRKAKELGNVPFITYAEDTCLGVGFHLLSYGSVVLTNHNSFLGNVGFAVNPWNLKEFSQYYEFKMQYINKGKNKIRLNRFEDFKQEDIDWLKNILNKRVDSITDHIIKARGSKIKDQESSRSLLKTGDLILPEDALKQGFVDEIINPDEYVLREFGKDACVDVVQKNWKQKLGMEVYSNLMGQYETTEGSIEDQIFEMAMNYSIMNNMRVPMEI